jgi:hypothetical protein
MVKEAIAMEKELCSCAPEEECREVFAEVSLFEANMTGSEENGDCSCFSCDGNPCIKLAI